MKIHNFVERKIKIQKQQGVALMLVIFVFALISILAVGMYNRQSIFVQTAGNVMAHTQAYQYALAGEIFGSIYIKKAWEDQKQKNEFYDDLKFVQDAQMFPIENAILEGQYNDVQGKLNINDLVTLVGTVNPVMKTRFDNLFRRLALETIKVEMLIDWLDENQDPEGFEGVEDGEYQSLETPYRNAGQSMRDLSELRLLPNVSSVDFQKLLPHVTVLPMGRAPLNVNTATEEVLQSLSSTLTDQQVSTLVEQREKEPWKNIQDFLSDPLISAANIKNEYMGVSSDFFEMAIRVTLADRKVRLLSLVARNNQDGTVQVIKRDQGQKYLITKEQAKLP